VIRVGLCYRRTQNDFDHIIWKVHTPLISHERWVVFNAQLVINRNCWGKQKEKKENALSGLHHCINGGSRICFNKKRKTAPILAWSDLFCSNFHRSIREKFILAVVQKALSGRATHIASLLARDLPPEHFAITEKIALYRSLSDLLLQPVIAQLVQQLRELEEPARLQEKDVAALNDSWICSLAPPEELRMLFLRFVAEVHLQWPDRSLPLAERHRQAVAEIVLKIWTPALEQSTDP
jgi:hypothetical protein